jgi:protocatechuate 3,4-dioxygenase beta subunit
VRRAIFLTVSVAVLAVAFAAAQVGSRPSQPQTQSSSGPPADQPKATALILGQVVDGTSGQPIADAIVTLNQAGGRGRGANPLLGAAAGGNAQQQAAIQAAAAAVAGLGGRGNSPWPMRVMTGADGRFVFHDLAPGGYQLSAGLTGYTASLNATVGGGGGGVASLIAAAMAGSGAGGATSLSLKEGEFATSLKMRLWKHAVITGLVSDDAGEPAIGVTVQVARRAMVAGRARYIPGAIARTDDRGAFRINGLVPGNYVVVVPQTQVSIPTSIMSSLIDSVTGNGPAGGGLAMLDVMTSGIDPSGAMGGGLRIGDYMVSSSGMLPILSPDGHLLVFQTMFYPGAASPVQATVVSLTSGEERGDVNFQLRLIPTSRVSGTAIGPDGPVANLGVRLVVPGDGTVSESEFDVATAMSRADGSFTFYGVPPGEFVLRASKQPRPEMPAEILSNPLLGQMFGGAAGGKQSTETLFASTTVSVAGDVDAVALQLAPGFHVGGRLEFESRSGRAAPTGQQLQAVSVLLTSVDGRSTSGGILGAFSAPDRANQQGEFRTKGFMPGKYFLTVSAPAGWFVKSATIGGRDVLDAPLDLSADVAGVVVTMTDKLGQVTGNVTAPGETDLSETTVVLFPYAYKAWITNGMSSRLVRTARASRSGAYTIGNLPAGEYLVAAIDRAAEGDMQDPAVIEAFARAGTRVTVTADPVTLDLTKVRVGK